MKFSKKVIINNNTISINHPTYFIADIAANHDGDLERAKTLIWLAKEAGANAVKFQHFKAKDIVSDFGFKTIKNNNSHQSSWEKSVYDIYKQYECDRGWTQELVKTAEAASIDFFSTPYDYEAIELLDQHIPAYKIGSGDITWIDFIQTIAKKNKPIFIATGASDMNDVERAINAITNFNNQIILMQCNTNYTGSLENFKYINLNVLKTYALKYPDILLGLSDHTPLYTTVLGAIALGARAIEKHFTDDNNRKGPDHAFSLNPKNWKDMVTFSRELELSLGDGIKKIEENEQQSVIVQRRSIRLKKDLLCGEIITENDIEFLRPAPDESLNPWETNDILGKKIKVSQHKGDLLLRNNIEV